MTTVLFVSVFIVLLAVFAFAGSATQEVFVGLMALLFTGSVIYLAYLMGQGNPTTTNLIPNKVYTVLSVPDSGHLVVRDHNDDIRLVESYANVRVGDKLKVEFNPEQVRFKFVRYK